MTDETDSVTEVARVLGEHYDGAIRMDAWVCAACGAALAMPAWNAMVEGTTGPLLRKAVAKHQAAMLAEAGLLRDEKAIADLGQSIIALLDRIQHVRTQAEGWAAKAPEDDWAEGGIGETALADAGRAILATLGAVDPEEAQIATQEPAGALGVDSAGRGASGGLGGAPGVVVVDFTADTSKFENAMLRHRVALLERQLKRSRDAEAVIERVEAMAEREHAHGDAITRCNLVAQRIRDAIDGPKATKNENEDA